VSTGDRHFSPPNGGDLAPALSALREHLGELQLPQIAHRRRAIILFEGPHGAGKKFVLKQLAAALDPCHFVVHSTAYDRREGSEGHWLARFWRQLPSAGNTAIFFRSWYRRILEDRVLGRTAADSVARVFDEINEFEAQQRDYATLLVKLYFDVSADSRSVGKAPGARAMRMLSSSPPMTLRISVRWKSYAATPTPVGRRGGPSTAMMSSRRRLLPWKPLQKPGRRRCRPNRRNSSLRRGSPKPGSLSSSPRSSSRPRAGARSAGRRSSRR
jgi:hypothetical protein